MHHRTGMSVENAHLESPYLYAYQYCRYILRSPDKQSISKFVLTSHEEIKIDLKGIPPHTLNHLTSPHHGCPLPMSLRELSNAHAEAFGIVHMSLLCLSQADRLGVWGERHLSQVYASGG